MEVGEGNLTVPIRAIKNNYEPPDDDLDLDIPEWTLTNSMFSPYLSFNEVSYYLEFLREVF